MPMSHSGNAKEATVLHCRAVCTLSTAHVSLVLAAPTLRRQTCQSKPLDEFSWGKGRVGRAPVAEEDGVGGCMSPALPQRQQLLILCIQLPHSLHVLSNPIQAHH